MIDKKVFNKEQILKTICSELNNFINIKSTLIFVISQLQELTRCEAISIRLTTTAYALTGDMEKCIEAGMDDYITKPINVEKLFNTINRYIK